MSEWVTNQTTDTSYGITCPYHPFVLLRNGCCPYCTTFSEVEYFKFNKPYSKIIGRPGHE